MYALQRFLYNNRYLQEFSIVIPDVEADQIESVNQGVYILHVTWNIVDSFLSRWLHCQDTWSCLKALGQNPLGAERRGMKWEN